MSVATTGPTPATRPATSHAAATGPAPDGVRRLTGFKPTGPLQLGNLLGAIAPMIAGQATTAPHTAVVMIVDLHALTVDHRPHEVRSLTLEQATTLIAAGVDPARSTLCVQSHLPEHTELHYLLECVTGYGEAHRMIQFRERADGQHSRLSLLTYPVLMAADILLHDTEELPVGDDQRQHLELARTVAGRFNTRYGETFTVPRGIGQPVAGRVMDLADPTSKMGKSQGGQGVLFLLDPPDVLHRKIKRAVTDPDDLVRYDPAAKPGVSNLLEILAGCTGRPDPAALAADLTSYRQLKAAVTDAVIDLLAPIQRRYHALAGDREEVAAALAAGRDRARERAAATLTRARRAIGLLPHRPAAR